MNADPVQRARALQPLVLEHADQADRERRLPAAVARAFARAGLYRIGAPFACGGEAADPIAQIETIEAIAMVDGSAAWNLMIGVETFGLLAPGLGRCQELIADPEVILCSSTAAVGRADAAPGGFRVSGQWPFVSGCHNSDVFGATVRLYAQSAPLPDRGNCYAMIELAGFEIVDTWHVNGLRGSPTTRSLLHSALLVPLSKPSRASRPARYRASPAGHCASAARRNARWPKPRSECAVHAHWCSPRWR